MVYNICKVKMHVGATVIKTSCYCHKDRQIRRTDKTSRNKPTIIQKTNFYNGIKVMETLQPFQQIVLEQSDIHMQKMYFKIINFKTNVLKH